MSVGLRPGPFPGRGVVTSVLACALLTACSPGRVSIDDQRELSAADRTACESLVADLPDTLSGEPRRTIDPEDALGAAWGDPAYVLTCGVAEPTDYTPTAECSVISGVGWWVPDPQLTDARLDATPIALSLRPYVRVLVPSAYRTDGIDLALADLAPALEEHLGEGLPCL